MPGRNSIEVTFPYEVVEKEANKNKLSISEFLKRFHAVAQYNNFEGVLYSFEEIKCSVDAVDVKNKGSQAKNKS